MLIIFLRLTSGFSEVTEGDLGKMRAEHFSVKFLLCLPTTERRRAQRGKIRRVLSSEFGRHSINLKVVNNRKIYKDLIKSIFMAEYQGSKFVGIVEHVKDTSSYDYCSFDTQSGVMRGHGSVQDLGETIAYQFGENFRQKITYELPQGINTRGTERGLCPKKYHKLSALEQDEFEKSVLSALQSKE